MGIGRGGWDEEDEWDGWDEWDERLGRGGREVETEGA